MDGRCVVGTVDRDFQPDRDVALGPWCFVGSELVYPQWEDLDFPDPFPTPQDWVDADANCRVLARDLLPVWTERLQVRTECGLGPKFWRVVLLNWLCVAVPALWSRYRHVQELVRRHGRRALRAEIVADSSDWRLACTEDLLPYLWSAEGDLRLSSLVLEALAPPTWTVVKHPSPARGDPAYQLPQSSAIRRWIGRLAVNHVPGLGIVGRLALSAVTHLLPRGAVARDHLDRLPGRTDGFPPDFLDLLDRFLYRVLPHTFQGGFASLLGVATAQGYHPGRLLVDMLNSEDDCTRMVVALAHEKGERLVGSQHGGTYGTHRAMMASAATEYPFHGFLTWGWDRQDAYPGTFVPVPSPLLSRMADRHREKNGRLILVGGSMVVHGTRLGWLPKPVHYLSYRRAKLDFVNTLAGSARRALSYRPYRRNVTVLEDADFLHRHAPDIPLVEGDLNQALLGCRLLVLDHPITTMLVAMAANIPTILYWERDAWPSADSAEPYFQRLRDAGILFHDPKAAADKVNAVWTDVPGWWHSTEVQAARRAFAHRFARTSRWWWVHWLRALWRLARQSG